MDVELVSIGTELLLGYTIDTNSAFFAREAAAEGIRVVHRATVGDGPEEIAAAVRDALARTGAVITSGGLGPTADDLTKPSIAELFGRGMTLDESILEDLKRRWAKRGWPGELPAANRNQALIPAGAEIIRNDHGSAPGIWLEDEQGHWCAMLPGVPREFRGMAREQLIPRLVARRGDAVGLVVRSRTLRTTGIAESKLADEMGELAKDPLGTRLAYLPGWEGVDLRVSVWNEPADRAAQLLDDAERAIRAKVGTWIYGVDDDDLAALVLQLLRERSHRIAVAESCTGGMLGMRLTAVPGSSDVVDGGTIAYANHVKVRELGVREATLQTHGAVSEETAREMASGVRTRFGVEVGVGITGVAGPGGGTPDKPVGTVCIAADVGGQLRSARTTMVGDRHEVRQRSTQAALNLVRRMLLVLALCAAPAACASSGSASAGSAGSPAVEANRVYTVAEVTRQAEARFGQNALRYPPELRIQGLIGRVEAEFIVNARGRIEPESFVVLSSTHADFTQEVKDAIPTLEFLPARVGRTPVRVRMRLGFDFKLSEFEGARRPE